MTNILGPYYSPWHWRGEDEDYMRQLDPAWARIHQPSARAIETVQRNAPNARIMLRSWDIDDNNGERKREIYADPKGAARKHLDMWRVKWDELVEEMRRNNWQPDESRWYIGLVNEPDPAFVPQVVEYSLEAMRLVKGTMIRLGVVVSSVGTFSKPSENDQGWTKFIPLEKPINDGGHILLVHEYWQPEGPSYGEDAGNLAWRHHIIPLDVPILIAESGANGYIYQRHSQNDDAGWQKFMKPEQYAAQVKEFVEGCDHRVKGVLLYMLDFHSAQWRSFDTQPAMHQLLAIKSARPQKPSPFATKPIDTRLPVIMSPGATVPNSLGPTPLPTGPHAIVSVPAGANIRTGPGLDYPVRGAEPLGTTMAIIGRNADSTWYQVDMPHATGWVSATVVDLRNVASVPVTFAARKVTGVAGEPVEPAPSVPSAPGIINPLTALAFLQVESGNVPFTDGLLTIRFEVHRFKVNLKNDALFDRHFKFTPGNYAEQYWRAAPDLPWLPAHGTMVQRHMLLSFAMGMDEIAALRSTGMGLGQVMGEGHLRIGYSTVQAMFAAFKHKKYGVNAQILGFVNYCLSDAGLLEALRKRDWMTAVRKYNGLGQEHIYIPALEKALNTIQQEVGT